MDTKLSMDIREFLLMQNSLQKGMAIANPTQKGSPYAMTEEELAQFITWNVTALISELSEMLNEVGWKPWASSRHINGAEALHEMVDAFHFFLNILLAIGSWDRATITDVAEAFTEYYQEKNQKNLERQEAGYDGVSTKCLSCKREMSETNCTSEYCEVRGYVQ